MFADRWYKVLNDLWGNKTRTIIIVVSIAVGLFAVGTVLSARMILSTEMAKSYATIDPSDGTVRTLEPFDESFLRSVQGMESVAEADARRTINTRIQVGPGEWLNLLIFVIEDYDAMRVNKIRPQSGAWPPPEREILIERSALSVIHAREGDSVLIETSDEKQRQMRIAGVVHDLAQLPAWADNSPYGYISFDTLEWFGEPFGYNELHIVTLKEGLRGESAKNHAQQVVNEIKDKAEKSGLTIPMSMAAEPGQVPLDDILQAILMLMGFIGLMSLFLSAFLIINTISALLAQQRRQIGVMKAIGASTRQIMGMYIAMTTIYGLIALVVAVPLSIVGSHALSIFMASMFNFDLSQVRMPQEIIFLQFIIGLLLPILASLIPIIANLRVTAAEAMSAYIESKGSRGAGIVDRMLSGENLWFARRVLKRPILLAVRNTFRSKGRLALTLITLSMSSAIFVSVFSVRASLFRTVDDLLVMWNFDTMIVFSRPYRVEKIAFESQQVPGVVKTDGWIQIPARRLRPDGSESGMIYLFAPRADSELAISPTMVEGRWITPHDENAVVVTTILLQEEPDIQLGDEIVLKLQGRDQIMKVIGVSKGILLPMIYANYPYVSQITGRTGRVDAALVATTQHDSEYVNLATNALEEHFERHGIHVSNVQTMATEREEAEVVYGIVISLMMIMAVLLAIVGGLGLMGAMSINVLERTREIGVLRAIGAPNRGVAKVFIFEGITIGVLSWLIGSVVALPMGKFLSDAVGIPLSGAPLTFSFSVTGVWLWLIIVIFLSALASFVPARNASRLTVREVLAYE